MVLVDVFVPSVDKTYDFQLNENIAISVVIEEIAEMVGQKEKSQIVGSLSKMELCSSKDRVALHKEQTLPQSGVVTGDSLILV